MGKHGFCSNLLWFLVATLNAAAHITHNPAILCNFFRAREVHFANHECSVENKEMQMSNYILGGRIRMQMFFL